MTTHLVDRNRFQRTNPPRIRGERRNSQALLGVQPEKKTGAIAEHLLAMSTGGVQLLVIAVHQILQRFLIVGHISPNLAFHPRLFSPEH